jgi:hypothetical protein
MQGVDTNDISLSGTSAVSRKRRDLLLDAVFENPEIRRAQTDGMPALCIGHEDRNENARDIGANDRVLLRKQRQCREEKHHEHPTAYNVD